ncbi:restriction endonuclease [Cupriavidus pauculus]
MTVPWRAYQEDVAALFRALGFSVNVEQEVEGGRGLHIVDVLARKVVGGVTVTWLVECKLWNSAIPKEKVAALYHIVSDVGADRGFLVSESGFQAGAIRSSQHSNITLASLDELREIAKEELEKSALARLAGESHRLQGILHGIFFPDDGSRGPLRGAAREDILDLLANIVEIKVVSVPKAQAGEFPIKLHINESSVVCHDASEFILAATEELERVSACIHSVQREVRRVRELVGAKAEVFSQEIARFLNAAETVLIFEHFDDIQVNKALQHMKLVGIYAGELRDLLSGRASRALHKVMRTLIDGPYLFLPLREINKWATARESVELAVAALIQELNSAPSSYCAAPEAGREIR